MKNDISHFKEDKNFFETFDAFIVVKSQDQIERRKRMIENREKGKIGRIKKRPVAKGLLLKAQISSKAIQILWTKEFDEPRHIKRFGNNYLLTEMNQLLLINSLGKILKSYQNSWFAFLHTVDVNKNRALLTSSGYDMVLEIDLENGKETWRWEAWKNGFNPDDAGNYLTTNKKDYEKYNKKGLKTLWVKPENYGRQGILTAHRTAHPNMAYYHPYKKDKILIAIAHDGTIYEVDRNNYKKSELTNFLHQMAHGLKFHMDKWIITDTTQALFYSLKKDFSIENIYKFANLKGKHPDAHENEWIQQITPVNKYLYIALDANRGLIIFDIQKKIYQLLPINENWCIQDCLII